MKPKILIVDDERNVRLMYRSALETIGYDVFEAESAEKATAEFAQRRFDLAIVDLRLPGRSGLDLLHEMAEQKSTTPAVVITAHGDVPNAVEAMKLGAIDFLQKPVLPDQLRQIVKEILLRHTAAKQREEKRDYLFYIRSAKRAINLRDFPSARKNISEALTLNDRSAEGFNLAGVLAEMREDYDKAKRYYGQAIKIDAHFEPAQQNMRRIFELFQFGESKEPINIDTRNL
jgi:DNA-binding NtrC family response regulator